MESNYNNQLNYIAVIGMSGRFPAADNVSEYWDNLMQGKQSSVELTDEELRASGVPDQYINDPDFVKKAYVVEDIDKFDAGFFQFTPREAEITDPQQRILLECCFEAFEHAGYSSEQYDGLAGVYVGTGPQAYYIRNLLPNQELLDSVGTLRMSIGNEKSFASTMVSYKMNLKGPSVNVDTACSTSLVAVHQACQSLLSYDCDVAMAGGVSLDVPQKIGMMYKEGSIISPDGRCRPFDADAKGTVKGNGAGIVVLKRLVDALEDGDTVYAVIKGSALNNDGSVKVGYTASSTEGQADVISEAIARADIDVESIKFVEAHGTGTILGDPIEIQALSEVYQAQTDKTAFCAVGSVKANVGHLDIAAGVAGLIKSSMAMHHGVLPKLINFESANPNIDFSSSPFYPAEENINLNVHQEAVHAGVSSFGIGGSNVHVIVGNAPAQEAESSNREQQLLLLSAKSQVALDKQTQAFAQHLEAHPEQDLADVAYTLQVGRNQYPYRAAVVASDHASAAAALKGQSRGLTSNHCQADSPSLYFMFPGQGAQHLGMGADLYQNEAEFKQQVDRCAELFQAQLGLDVRQEMFHNSDESRINSTQVSQPVLFTMEYSLAKLWQAQGIQPKAMIGHSIGEYVAACIAEVFSLEDAIKLISARARLMQSMEPGAMLMVHLSEQDIQPYLSDTCSLAAVNGPHIAVLSGSKSHLETLEADFSARDIHCRILQTSHAFHSWMMEPMLQEYEQVLRTVSFQAPTMPYMSNVSGDWIDSSQATDPNYWIQHLRGTVRFGQGLQTLLADSQAVLLEVGPNQVLTTLAKRSFEWQAVVPSARHPKDNRCDVEQWLQSAGALWMEGVSIDWSAVHDNRQRRRVGLPTYQFDRQSHWVGFGLSDAERNQAALDAESDQAQNKGKKVPKTVAGFIEHVWCEAFGVAKIQPQDGFFELGGDSLLATQMVSIIKQQLRVDVSLSELFNAANFAEFVSTVESKNSGDSNTHGGMGIQRVEPDLANRDQPFPLTDIQQAYWVGRTNAIELGDVATHIYLEVDIKSGDVEKFQSAWNKLIQHHDMLRAIFLDTGEQQILAEVPEYQFDILDLQAHQPEDAEREQLALREKMSHQVLPCDTWPLFDIKVAKYQEKKFRICISIDILIVDAWSMNMLIEQWLHLYRDIDFQLRDLAFSFRDYVIAEHGLRETELYYDSEQYWFDRIDTLPAAPSLPLAISPNALEEVKFERRVYEMEADRWSALKQKAIAHSVTPTSLLIAAFSEVLALWCQSPHFTLNLTNYSRHPFHDDAEFIVGDFTSLTLLEVYSDASKNFAENAERVQKQLWSDLDNRYVSAIHVLREMGKRRGGRASMPIVFTSTLGGRALEHESSADELGEEVFGVSQTSQVWLDHQVMEWQGKLRFNWDAVEALFPEGMIQKMFDAYCQYIERLVDDENAWSTTALNHLLPEADAALIAEANATDSDAELLPLQASFYRAAQQYPNNIAVFDRDTEVSYQRLYGYAQLLGQQLRQQGIKPNQIVGIYIEKSWQQLAAVMGILASGAAYLPLDVNQPEERLNYIIGNSGMVGMVTANSQAQSLPQQAQSLFTLNLDTYSQDQVQQAATQEPLSVLQSLDDLAYVLYTSGSTGEPKGAMLPHRGPANTVQDMARIMAIGPQDRLIGLSALHFDLSVFDVFGTLSTGAALVMVPASAELEAGQWHSLIHKHQISAWNSVPALVQIYVDHVSALIEEGTLEPQASHPLQRVVMSGDWIPPKLPARMFEMFKGIKVLGSGGPTECSIWDAFHWVQPEDTEKESIPYGYPMANHKIHILNPQLQTCPVGVSGEMYVGGYGLALGYLGDQEKTDALFITHPETGERLYKSGDLGRYTGIASDGLEILGRSDFQVKINGYRIELGEIENAIREQGTCEDVVVVAQSGAQDGSQQGKGKKQLVAYLLDKNASEENQGDVSGDDIQAKLVEFKLSKPGIRKTQESETELALPAVVHDTQAYKVRKSYRQYLGEGLVLEQISRVLGTLSEYRNPELPMPKYRYASAGSLHPVQVYLYIKPEQITGLEQGFYYYNPESHKLTRLAQQQTLTRASWGQGENPNIYESAAFSLFLVGESAAIDPVYGAEDARGMMYLEAGYMSQLLLEVAPSEKVGLCPIGYIDSEVEQMLGLGDSQSILHCIVGGSITQEQVDNWSVATNHQDASSNHLESPQAALKKAIAAKLPAYMIPSAFVSVPEFPLTANGKVDRKQLSQREVQGQGEQIKVPPKNDTESHILKVWKEILELEHLGTEDNFFEIGGDSVLILRVHQRLTSELGVTASVVDLFKYPKVSELAEFLGDVTTAVKKKDTGVDKQKLDKQKAAIKRQRKIAKARS